MCSLSAGREEEAASGAIQQTVLRRARVQAQLRLHAPCEARDTQLLDIVAGEVIPDERTCHLRGNSISMGLVVHVVLLVLFERHRFLVERPLP